MARLYCPCEQQYPIWGEFWWTGKYAWVFFDDWAWSETYTEQLTQCPACGHRLERENLGRVTYRAQPEVRGLEALVKHACQQPQQHTIYWVKALEKGLRLSQAFIRGMIQADRWGVRRTHSKVEDGAE